MAGGVADGAALEPAVVRELVAASRGARRIGPALSAVASVDLRGVLAGLPLPVGALWGRDDRVIPPGGLQTVRRLRPDAVCEIVDGRGTSRWSSGRAPLPRPLQRVVVAIS